MRHRSASGPTAPGTVGFVGSSEGSKRAERGTRPGGWKWKRSAFLIGASRSHTKNDGSMTIPTWVWSLLAGMLLGTVLVGVGTLADSDSTPTWPASERAGDEAPDFVLETLDGDPFRLAAHRGEVVVNGWATWCLPCRAAGLRRSSATTGRGGRAVRGHRRRSGRSHGGAALRGEAGFQLPADREPVRWGAALSGREEAHVRDRQVGPHPLQLQRRAADVGATGRAGDAGETSP